MADHYIFAEGVRPVRPTARLDYGNGPGLPFYMALMQQGVQTRPSMLPPSLHASPTGLDFQNGDGYSSELVSSFSDNRLNNGRETNIPMLVPGQVNVRHLLDGNPPTPQQREIAIQWALQQTQSGNPLPGYDTWQQADQAEAAHHAQLDEYTRQHPEMLRW